jgi:hypothetical protein
LGHDAGCALSEVEAPLLLWSDPSHSFSIYQGRAEQCAQKARIFVATDMYRDAAEISAFSRGSGGPCVRRMSKGMVNAGSG